MDAYLSKPIDPALLYATLEHDTTAATPSVVTKPAAQRPPVDHDQLMTRLGHDAELLADVVRLFLEDCPARLAAIKAAVDDRDGPRIRSTAHALKGVAGNLSAAGLFAATQLLERLGAEGRLDAAEAAWRGLSVEAADVINALRQFEATGNQKMVICAS
jgi:HPt (histidine-containing phosphotransfer) domain-containing protein